MAITRADAAVTGVNRASNTPQSSFLSLFVNFLRYLDYAASTDRIIHELVIFGKKWLWPTLGIGTASIWRDLRKP